MACSAELRIARLVGQSVLFRVQLITTYSRQLHCPRTLVHFNDHMPNECKLNQLITFYFFIFEGSTLRCTATVAWAMLTSLDSKSVELHGASRSRSKVFVQTAAQQKDRRTGMRARQDSKRYIGQYKYQRKALSIAMGERSREQGACLY